jgi:hypothetical protein
LWGRPRSSQGGALVSRGPGERPWVPGGLWVPGRFPGFLGSWEESLGSQGLLWIPGRPPGSRGPGEGRWGLWECPLGSWGVPRSPRVLGRVPRNMSSGVHPPASPVIGMLLGCLICWQNGRREKLREKMCVKKRFIFSSMVFFFVCRWPKTNKK